MTDDYWSSFVGRPTQLQISPTVQAFCPPPEDPALALLNPTRRIHGDIYHVEMFESGSETKLVFTHKSPPDVAELDRDDFWLRRLEISAALLEVLEDEPAGPNKEARAWQPIAIAVMSLLSAQAAITSIDDLRRRLYQNTQRKIAAYVDKYLGGSQQYDLARYSMLGPRDPGYSHVRHFSWIYAQEIVAIISLLDEAERLRVVDLGSGDGHFLVTLAQALAARSLDGRVELVSIDKSSDCSRFALEATSNANIEHRTDDITDSFFADRLRRLVPDVVVANHVIEHLPGDFQHLHLDDWLLAANRLLAISVPLNDRVASSMSNHVHEFTREAVEGLARHVGIRVGFAVSADEPAVLSRGGICIWRRSDSSVFAGGLVELGPRRVPVTQHELLPDLRWPFDPDRFHLGSRRIAPRIAQLDDTKAFSEIRHPRQVRQFLIKAPGSRVVLPYELSKFLEAVQLVVDHNYSANDWYPDAYAYLSIFQGLTLFSSYRGLSLSCHTDQMQTLRRGMGYAPDWSYIVSDTLPTTLFAQDFDISDAVERANRGERVNLYDYFNAQARMENAYTVEPYGIYLMSPYMVHSAQAADEDIYRVFMKIAFTTKRFFDNRELRLSPAFDTRDWYLEDTVGYKDGWFSHAHWNERYLQIDIVGNRATGGGNLSRGWERSKPSR
jgi:2-polyprenyl-3-methyl-5-hydroxy-6-metoxy-1,4-benzoquinol methylase